MGPRGQRLGLQRPEGGWEYPVFLVAASLVEALLGDGRYALANRLPALNCGLPPSLRRNPKEILHEALLRTRRLLASPHRVTRARHPRQLKKVDNKEKTIEGGGDYWKVNPRGYVPRSSWTTVRC